MRQASRPRQRGQSVAEMALLTPFLLILCLGAAEIGNAYNSYTTLVSAAREGARLGARGNVFRPSQVLQVVEQHSGRLSLQTDATVIYTVVTADPAAATPFLVSSATILNNGGASHFSTAGLRTLQQQLTTTGLSAPYTNYLRKEKFVIVELIYEHHTIFGLGQVAFLNLEPIQMYTYTIMPVSAPS